MRTDLQGQALDGRFRPGLKASDFVPGPCVWRRILYEARHWRRTLGNGRSFALSAGKVPFRETTLARSIPRTSKFCSLPAPMRFRVRVRRSLEKGDLT
jgi:hypothetical protein